MLESIVFGIIQGVFEWLPISSQGNLVLLMIGAFNYSTQKALHLSIFLHTGTLLAILIYFKEDIKKIILSLKNYKPGFRESSENNLLSFLFVSTIITGLIGYPLFKLLMASTFSGEIFIALVGVGLIFTGIFQKIAPQKELKTKKNLSLKDSLLLGIVQGFSVIPGISRSGITIATFLFRGYKSEEALRLSFLMSIPVVLAAEIGLGIIKGLPEISIFQGILGLFFAFLFGLLTIHLLIGLARKIKFWIFCIVIGVIALLPLMFYLLS